MEKNFLSVLKKRVGITYLISLYEIAVEGFGMLHLLQKTEQIKTDADLVNSVCLESFLIHTRKCP